jgi:hypothetical protein
MNSFDFPVFVHEKDDDSVMEFLTFTSMEADLDVFDVQNGEYEAWDARGRCLKLGVGKPMSEWPKIILRDGHLEWLTISLRGGQASQEDFTALKNRAEKRAEFEPLSKRLLRRLAKAKWRKIES